MSGLSDSRLVGNAQRNHRYRLVFRGGAAAVMGAVVPCPLVECGVAASDEMVEPPTQGTGGSWAKPGLPTCSLHKNLPVKSLQFSLTRPTRRGSTPPQGPPKAQSAPSHNSKTVLSIVKKGPPAHTVDTTIFEMSLGSLSDLPPENSSSGKESPPGKIGHSKEGSWHGRGTPRSRS